MDLLATGNTVKPGLPARNGDAASEGEKSDESATFEVFLDLALTVPSPDAVIVPGPEGKPAPGDGLAALLETTGNPAMPPGNILPVDLPLGLEAIDGAPGAAARSDKAFAATTPLAIPVIAQPTVEARSEAPVADRHQRCRPLHPLP